jgi:hypothetical protein
MKFVELFYDAEITRKWSITVWDIDAKDFDPEKCNYTNLNVEFVDVHEAKAAQATIAQAFKTAGEKVYMNHSDMDSHFWVIPKWLQELLNPHNNVNKLISDEYTKKNGGATANGQGKVNKGNGPDNMRNK